MRHRPTALAALAVTLATTAGCGLEDPLNQPTPPHPQPPAASANEVTVPTRPGPSRSALATAAPTQAKAIERFGDLYVNWRHDTLVNRQRELAAISIGEASSMQRRAAASTPADYELRRAKVANEGRIVALAPLRPPRHGVWVVVTHERTTGERTYDGLAPAYHVTIATVRQLDTGWVVSQWRPQI